MEKSKIFCDNCDVEIMEYYNEKYRGTRGRCTRCGVDFPLE